MVRLEAYQDGGDIGTGEGMVSFDKKSNTMTFSPTFNKGTDTQDLNINTPSVVFLILAYKLLMRMVTILPTKNIRWNLYPTLRLGKIISGRNLENLSKKCFW